MTIAHIARKKGPLLWALMGRALNFRPFSTKDPTLLTKIAQQALKTPELIARSTHPQFDQTRARAPWYSEFTIKESVTHSPFSLTRAIRELTTEEKREMIERYQKFLAIYAKVDSPNMRPTLQVLNQLAPNQILHTFNHYQALLAKDPRKLSLYDLKHVIHLLHTHAQNLSRDTDKQEIYKIIALYEREEAHRTGDV